MASMQLRPQRRKARVHQRAGDALLVATLALAVLTAGASTLHARGTDLRTSLMSWLEAQATSDGTLVLAGQQRSQDAD